MIESPVCARCRQNQRIPRSPYCQSCRSRKNLQEAARDQIRQKEVPDYHRRKNLWNRYRITPEEYDRLFTKQGGRCAICLSADPKSTHSGIFHVDHCHETTGVRGLLCYPCNAAIGMLKHDPQLLARAAAYLKGELAINPA